MVCSYQIQRIGSTVTKLSDFNTSAYYDNSLLKVYLNQPCLEEINDKNKNDSVSLIHLCLDTPFPDDSRRKHITRLTLNVTQACNLRCKYCYAEYGLYGQRIPAQEMEEFLNTLTAVVKYYHTIDRVQFFGGEPLLAPDKIYVATEFFELATKKKLITKLPRFSVVTNGVFLTKPEILSFLREKQFHVTVSCDGPPEITNILRPSSNAKQKSTYELLRDGLNAAKSSSLSLAIEATYTNKHQDLGISPTDILDHVKTEFKIPTVHIAPAAYSPWGDYRPRRPEVTELFFYASRESVIRLIVTLPI